MIGGRAVFEDSRTLRVEGDERRRRSASATPSWPPARAPAALPGLDERSERIMDSTAALELPDVPERLLVIGGGYIGLELGRSTPPSAAA